MSKQWKKEQVWPFLCCCTADSQTDAGNISCTTTARLYFFPLLVYHSSMAGYCVYFANLVIVVKHLGEIIYIT